MGIVLVSGGLIPTTKDTLLDARTKVSTFADIANIENPARFMVITVEDTGKKYEVRKLTSKVIGGLVVENAGIDINDPESLLDLGLAEELRAEEEKVRQSNENARKTAENKRVENENARKTAESQREGKESTRESNESVRKSNEETRQSNEDSRKTSESARVTAENTRKSNEASRVSAENQRSANESARKASETERKEAESVRQTNESERKTSESTRKSNESARIANETTRSGAEDKRIAAENTRVANEEERKGAELSREQAEGNRATTFETLKGELQTTIEEGQTANTLSEEATQRANAAAETIETWESVVVTVEDEGDVNDPESDIVNEALRKTEQTLTKAEQAQARTNLGAASLEENTAFKTEVTEANEAFKTEVNETVSSLSEGFSLFKESVQEQIDEQDESIEEYKEQTTAQVNEKISENFAKLIPTGMDVSCLTSLTRGNKSFVPIDVTMYPEGVVKNIICISDNKAVSVTPDGLMKVIGVGESTVHVVPTMNTSLAKTLEIKVTDPSVRLVNSLSIRLISSGSFRFN